MGTARVVQIAPEDTVRVGDELLDKRTGERWRVSGVHRSQGHATLVEIPKDEIGLNRAQRRALRKRKRSPRALD